MEGVCVGRWCLIILILTSFSVQPRLRIDSRASASCSSLRSFSRCACGGRGTRTTAVRKRAADSGWVSVGRVIAHMGEDLEPWGMGSGIRSISLLMLIQSRYWAHDAQGHDEAEGRSGWAPTATWVTARPYHTVLCHTVPNLMISDW